MADNAIEDFGIYQGKKSFHSRSYGIIFLCRNGSKDTLNYASILA